MASKTLWATVVSTVGRTSDGVNFPVLGPVEALDRAD